MSSHPGDVTQLLLAWSNGDRDAFEDLVPVVYGELRHIAARYFLHERPGHALQATGLVTKPISSSSINSASAGRTARSSSASRRS